MYIGEFINMYFYHLGCQSLFFLTHLSIIFNLQPIDQVIQVLINLLWGKLQLISLKFGHFLQDPKKLFSHANRRLDLQILEIYLNQVVRAGGGAHIDSLVVRAYQSFFTTLYNNRTRPHKPNLHKCVIIVFRIWNFLDNRKLFFRKNSVSTFLNYVRFGAKLVLHNFLETLTKLFPVRIVGSPDCDKNRVLLFAQFNVGVKFTLHLVNHFPDLDIRIVKNGNLLLNIVSQYILPGNVSNDPLNIFET